MIIQFINGDTIENVSLISFGYDNGKLVAFVNGKLKIYLEDISIIQMQ